MSEEIEAARVKALEAITKVQETIKAIQEGEIDVPPELDQLGGESYE